MAQDQILSGGGTHLANVNVRNQLLTRAIAVTPIHEASLLGNAFSWTAVLADIDTGDTGLLVSNAADSKWLVIELKRNQSSDETVGQVLRYMGWVQTYLANENEEVKGLIISLQSDEKIRFALKNVNNVSVAHYDVSFVLKEAELN